MALSNELDRGEVPSQGPFRRSEALARLIRGLGERTRPSRRTSFGVIVTVETVAIGLGKGLANEKVIAQVPPRGGCDATRGLGGTGGRGA